MQQQYRKIIAGYIFRYHYREIGHAQIYRFDLCVLGIATTHANFLVSLQKLSPPIAIAIDSLGRLELGLASG